jgi:hypothetical protein
MKMVWLLSLALVGVAGCSLAKTQSERRVGTWERYPEFRTCIEHAVPSQVHYGEVYESCLKLQVEDAQAMRCIKDQTPLEDLWQVKMCQRQLRDRLAYGNGNPVPQNEPSEAWGGLGMGSFIGLVF